MKVDGGLTGDMSRVGESARALDAAGFDGASTAETAHDPFFPLLVAAQNSEKIELITSIAVAFSRSPMTLAGIGHDLNAVSQGRFVLGLGSQIRAHITKRFSMPWSRPAARMREYILALHAIWDNWYTGKPLDFRGEFYTHTLMTPMFTPTDTAFGAPKIFLAAVGPLMTQVAGEVADGIIIHPFTTEKYMREVTLPAIEKGLRKNGRSRDQFEISYPGFIVTGETEESFEMSRQAICKQIAFYGSTPAYAPVLALHGWGALQPELNVLSKQGQWDEMGTLITDEILAEFAIVAEPDQCIGQFKQRYAGLVDRTSVGIPARSPEHRAELLAQLRA
ncbi:MAG: LLM class F420-dependent oxidoreductase [Pseudomonadales bacterium]|nr:LLM class F420-dependent oxidoreductase [Pseudomonadales bacterium]MDP7594666.1 LLM class F420-dependent oxidoreductase [Pseudomonadales bacterium]HJN49748.1 LLM class F420-dependent oxidoreductase [Pseudomonadales bacterium]|tara:strand:+ start:14478 stop:15482 length:1005 start_codon:yes stop_codon:yes gene_type:complete